MAKRLARYYGTEVTIMDNMEELGMNCTIIAGNVLDYT
jgi:hypothetical protein